VRLLRRATAALDVRSRGTANVIDAMRATGTRRLIVQSTYGIGETYANLPLSLKAFFTFVIRPQVTDHVRQEELVRESGLDWTVVRPVVLEDTETETSPRVDLEDGVDSMKVSRTQLARVLTQAVDRDDWQGRTLSVSA
jgi:nucleoside-diphosphate-sugar epimerase